MSYLKKLFLMLAMLAALGVGMTGCGNGEMEEAGEEVGETMDEAVDEAEEATE
jgi:hypothetical protein